jgi:ABC-type multidrug transport system ATPase subunit
VRQLTIEARATRIRNRDDHLWELHSLDLCAANGIPILIEGESGSGKTSILRYLMGDPTIHASGSCISYTINGQSYSVNDAKKAKLLAYVGTEHPFLNWCSISDSISSLSCCFGAPIDSSDSFIQSSLPVLNLRATHLSKKPHQLSFGERRRLSILFSVSMKPRVLFIDEVFNGLDHINCQLISQFLLAPDLNRESIIIMTAHEPRLLAEQVITRFAVDTEDTFNENRIYRFRRNEA